MIDNCIHGELRLVNQLITDGGDINMGRLELCYFGVWSNVNSFYWNQLASNITCTVLGYNITKARPEVLSVTQTFSFVQRPMVTVYCNSPVNDPHLLNIQSCSIQPSLLASSPVNLLCRKYFLSNLLTHK